MAPLGNGMDGELIFVEYEPRLMLRWMKNTLKQSTFLKCSLNS